MIEQLPIDMAARPDAQMVARSLDGTLYHWRDLRDRVAYWRDQAERCPDACVAIFHSDSFEFLALLLALWQAQKTALIPGNCLPATLQSIAPFTASFFGEFPADHNPPSGVVTRSPNRNAALMMLTSGSSGAPTLVEKSFAQLNAELALLQQHWGEDDTGGLVLGTVSHHHMYGLPFRLLWPLLSGRVFLNRELAYLEQLDKLPVEQPVTLVSSPAHLQHLPPGLNWPQLQKNLQRVFSAGAPLAADDADKVRRLTGQPVTEIYGSTETGAVAWRQHPQNWQPLKGVSVRSEQGLLALRSPALADADWFVTQDLCEVSGDGSFSLLGRSDRIIKVGGKRVSASLIERVLQQSDWVADARVLLLPERKSRVGAVVELSAGGRAALVDQGKQALIGAFKAALADQVEAVAYPRYWRFVAHMPVNSQGKSTAAELMPLFKRKEAVTAPCILSQSVEGLNATLTLKAPADLLYLEGHFPAQPILPGVVQTTWAIELARQLFAGIGEFRRLEALKFQKVIQPEQPVTLQLDWDRDKSRLSFAYQSSSHMHSSGRIVFCGDPADE